LADLNRTSRVPIPLLKLSAAKTQAGAAYRLVEIQMSGKSEPVTPETFTYVLRKDKLRQARRREGHYLLRSNLCGENPAVLWPHRPTRSMNS
jgi:hypothetical protein